MLTVAAVHSLIGNKPASPLTEFESLAGVVVVAELDFTVPAFDAVKFELRKVVEQLKLAVQRASPRNQRNSKKNDADAKCDRSQKSHGFNRA